MDGARKDASGRAALALLANEEAPIKDGEATGQAAMDRLPGELWGVLLLVPVERRSYAEVAEIAKVSVAAVTSRVAQARDALRREVGR